MDTVGVSENPAPLRVLVLDDDEVRVNQVEEGLSGKADVYVAQNIHGKALIDLIARTSPDVIIMDCQSPDRDTIESLRKVAKSNPRPIVMFVEEQGAEQMQEAISAGVSAYVIDGLTPKRVKPIIDMAIARFNVMDGLKSELAKAKGDLAARKVIEKAKGLLMQHEGMSEDQAFSAMRDMSQKQGKPLKDVAENVIAILDLLSQSKGTSK
jgi:response regulator NasT